MERKIFRAYNSNLRGIGGKLLVHRPTGKIYRLIRVTGVRRESLRLVCEGPISPPLDYILGLPCEM